MDSGPSILSLCSGIGGLDLGIKLAFPGARTICHVEREAACCQILASRMEEGRLDPAPVWTDLHTFTGRDWSGTVDIIAAGYPCQPFSLAGKGLAEKDPRHLWPEVKRIIREVQPRAVVLENVQGHVKRGLDKVLLDLHELGFDAEWGVYSAAQAGAPHRRNRIFVLAYSRSRRFPFEWTTLYDDGSDAQRDDTDGCDINMADAERLARQRRGEPGDLERTSSEDTGEGDQRERSGEAPHDPIEGVADSGSERLQGIEQAGSTEGSVGRSRRADLSPPRPEEDWSGIREDFYPAVEPSLCGMVDGVPVRVDQLRALGNAVVPKQCALALRDLVGRIA